ncbi:hypothetical protein FACS1894159_06060 [Bacteroidia bacterium]|nr:hypothetical protein FACS1894159_06060 [Bacteroidia bacterium]
MLGISLASCTKDNTQTLQQQDDNTLAASARPGTMTVTVPGTRVATDHADGATKWSAGDKFALFDLHGATTTLNSPFTLQSEHGHSSGSFSGLINDLSAVTGRSLMAVYPHDEGLSYNANAGTKSLTPTLTLPAAQTSAELANLVGKLTWMAAKVSTDGALDNGVQLTFKQLTSVIAFTIEGVPAGEKVGSLTMSAGAATPFVLGMNVDFAGPDPVAVAAPAAETTATLSATPATPFATGGTLSLVLFPCTLAGVEVTYTVITVDATTGNYANTYLMTQTMTKNLTAGTLYKKTVALGSPALVDVRGDQTIIYPTVEITYGDATTAIWTTLGLRTTRFPNGTEIKVDDPTTWWHVAGRPPYWGVETLKPIDSYPSGLTYPVSFDQYMGYLYYNNSYTKFIPSGWHLPTKAEWQKLVDAAAASPGGLAVLCADNVWNAPFTDVSQLNAWGMNIFAWGYSSSGNSKLFYNTDDWHTELHGNTASFWYAGAAGWCSLLFNGTTTVYTSDTWCEGATIRLVKD